MNNKHNESNKKIIAPLAETEDLIRETVKSGGEFRLITAGVSMKPLLRNRKDTVVLVKAPAHLKRFDIPLYKRKDGQFVLHRVISCDKEGYVMCGDNQLIKEYGITDSDVIAVVSKIIRNGKTIDLQKSFSYKIYVFFYCRLFWIRKLWLRVCSVLRRIFSKIKRKEI